VTWYSLAVFTDEITKSEQSSVPCFQVSNLSNNSVSASAYLISHDITIGSHIAAVKHAHF
jgi:hypothetical protein